MGTLSKDYSRPVPQLCLAFMWVTDFIYETHQHLVTSLDQPWLLPQHLRTFADAIHQKGGALTNCWGFVDGTVRPICRPGMHQEVMYKGYNGYKRIHALKFQSVTAPNGLIAHLFGPVEGRRHDAYILHESRLLPELEARSHDLKVPFPGNNLGENQPAFNASMSKVRISVESAFGDIVNLFKFTAFNPILTGGGGQFDPPPARNPRLCRDRR